MADDPGFPDDLTPEERAELAEIEAQVPSREQLTRLVRRPPPPPREVMVSSMKYDFTFPQPQPEDVTCDACGVGCRREFNIESGVLFGYWGFESDRDGDVCECNLCEGCFAKVEAFIRSLGGRVRVGSYIPGLEPQWQPRRPHAIAEVARSSCTEVEAKDCEIAELKRLLRWCYEFAENDMGVARSNPRTFDPDGNCRRIKEILGES